jgi:hypothetical protein
MKSFKSILNDTLCALFIVGVIAGPFYAYIMGWV